MMIGKSGVNLTSKIQNSEFWWNLWCLFVGFEYWIYFKCKYGHANIYEKPDYEYFFKKITLHMCLKQM